MMIAIFFHKFSSAFVKFSLPHECECVDWRMEILCLTHEVSIMNYVAIIFYHIYEVIQFSGLSGGKLVISWHCHSIKWIITSNLGIKWLTVVAFAELVHIQLLRVDSTRPAFCW
jgi:hypothetical protein